MLQMSHRAKVCKFMHMYPTQYFVCQDEKEWAYISAHNLHALALLLSSVRRVSTSKQTFVDPECKLGNYSLRF